MANLTGHLTGQQPGHKDADKYRAHSDDDHNDDHVLNIGQAFGGLGFAQLLHHIIKLIRRDGQTIRGIE